MTSRVIEAAPKPSPDARCAEGFRVTLSSMSKEAAVNLARNMGFAEQQICLALDEGGNLHDKRSDLMFHFGAPGSNSPVTLDSPLIVTKWGIRTATCPYGHSVQVIDGRFIRHGEGICAYSGQPVRSEEYDA